MHYFKFLRLYYTATMADFRSHPSKNETDSFKELFRHRVLTRKNRKYYILITYLTMLILIALSVLFSLYGAYNYMWLTIILIVLEEIMLWLYKFSLLLILFNYFLYKNDNNIYKKLLNQLFLDSGYYSIFYDKDKIIRSIYKINSKSLFCSSYYFIGKEDSVIIKIKRNRIILKYYKEKIVIKNLNSIEDVVFTIKNYCYLKLKSNKKYEWKYQGLALKNKYVTIHEYKMSIKKCHHYNKYKCVSCEEYPEVLKAEICRAFHHTNTFDFLLANTKDGYIYFLKEELINSL